MTSAPSNKVTNCGHKRVRRLFKKCLHSIFKKIVDIQVSNEIESPMHSSLSKRYCHFGTVDIILKHSHGSSASSSGIVVGWGTIIVKYISQDLQLITWPVVSNGFGICYIS